MRNQRTSVGVRLGLAVAGLAAILTQTGCPFLGCGVGPVEGQDAGTFAFVSDAGVIVFDPTLVGQSVAYQVIVADSADTDETLLGASFSGAGANDFQVLSTFPIAIPAGTQATVEVQFTPSLGGAVAAQLLLQTKDMGVSPVEISGTGLVTDGG